MGKILLTGMSAPQASAKANKTSTSFAAVINEALVSAGHSVVWSDPHIALTKESIDDFDSVLVGISPLNSLGANRAYGALSTISSVLEHSPSKLNLFIDAPNVSQIDVSLRAVSTNPELLVKSFYSYRKDYSIVKSDKNLQKKLMSVVETLLNNKWPTTLYPSLPWKTDDSVASKLPSGAASSLAGISLDSFLLEAPVPSYEIIDKWCLDNPQSKWTKSTVSMLGLPCVPMKITKGSTDLDVEAQISRSIGVLISPDKKQDTWWSYRYIQALNKLTPIATNWKESQTLDSSWAVLAATIESSSPKERLSIALAQRESYEQNTPDRIEATTILLNALRISKEK
jgi:hypothetical protein